MSAVVLVVAPGANVAVPAVLSWLTAEIVYMRTVETQDDDDDLSDLPTIVQETVRVELEQLAGRASLVDVSPQSQLELRVLVGNGGSALRKVVTIGDQVQDMKLAFEAADVAAIAAAIPDPPTPTTAVVERRAYFVLVGEGRYPFEASKLQVAPVTTGNGGWEQLGLDGLFKSQLPATSSINWTTSEWDPAVVVWTNTHLAIDGKFTARFAERAGDAWLWWLTGPQPVIGIVIDDLRRPRLVTGIPLPPGPRAADDLAVVPADVTESEVASNPDVYTEDPGEFCKPFKNPERVLGERSFFVTLRVEQPAIGSGPSIKTFPMPVLTFDPLPAAGDSATGRSAALDRVVDVVRSRLGGVVSDAPSLSFLRHTIPKAYAEMLRRFPRGRSTLDAEHPVQWEGDISRYQATTVARGHILEYRMRWRSNGYSLGTVAKTLTLAPRQTKRIQKIEWQRAETARRSETTRLFDQVQDSLVRERDYEDTVRAHLSEWARGESSSSTSAAAGGFGFAGPGFVIGGGGGGSHATSSSSSSGGRDTAASEEQQLRDAIRRYGDSLRRLESMVVNEVTQEETVTGTTEIIRNQNYGHALTIVYYQILRHLKIETAVAGVRECLFVPFAITPFTIARAYRWRDLIRRSLRDSSLAPTLTYLKDVLEGFASSDVPPGRRSDQPVRYVFGSVFIKLAIERPTDGADGAFDATAWRVLQPFLASPAISIFERLRAIEASRRDALFQKDHAPKVAATWVDTLELWAGSTRLTADFTLATRYMFNGVVRVDFTAPMGPTVTRETMSSLRVLATKDLPPGSVANLLNASFTYETDQFERTVKIDKGAHDLVAVETGEHDPVGVSLFAPPDAWERRDIRQEMTRAVHKLVEHLNEHVEYYTKAILWNLDRDRLFMLLDGFYVPGTNSISIASVVERDPVAIIGNSLVFRVSAGTFLGIGTITTPQQLRDHYVAEQASADPMLLSLPTDGLYAQTLMDECSALEEHRGNTDWALAEPDPELGAIAPELLVSRRAEPLPTSPTAFPQTIINLQNAPDAPAPSGLAGALAAVQNANAFRDMAGLAGTQANAAAALQTAAGLATTFGSQAAQLKLAQMAKDAQAAQTADQKLATVQRAADKKLVTQEEAQKHAGKVLESLYTPSGLSTQDVQSLTHTAGDNGADVALSRDGETIDVKTRDTGGFLDSIAPLFGGGSKAPKKTPTTKADALRLVTDFRSRTSSAKFLVSKTQFADGLERLINDPATVDQKDLFLCGPAAFLRVWIQHDPVGFAKYGIELYEEGRGYIGSKKIAPSSELRNTTWSAAWADAAEWVTMSSLRDVENAVSNYTGQPDEEFDGATSSGELVDWFNATGLYEMVSEKSSTFSTEDVVYAKAAKPSARVDVLLKVNANMLQGTKSKPEHWFLGETANHYIVLLAPLKFVGNDVTLEYWSWAEDMVGTKALTITKSKFADNYYGWIQAWKYTK